MNELPRRPQSDFPAGYGTLAREDVAALVHRFYDRVRADAMLGPIFEDAIGAHWDAHLERMVAFWATQMGVERGYKGDPFGKHLALEGLTKAHFEHWLMLFEREAKALFPEDVAASFTEKAGRIATSLQLGLFGIPGLGPVPAGLKGGQ